MNTKQVLEPETHEATNREVTAKVSTAALWSGAAFGLGEFVPESQALAFIQLTGLVVLILGLPWAMEGWARFTLWVDTRGYSADE